MTSDGDGPCVGERERQVGEAGTPTAADPADSVPQLLGVLGSDREQPLGLRIQRHGSAVVAPAGSDQSVDRSPTRMSLTATTMSMRGTIEVARTSRSRRSDRA